MNVSSVRPSLLAIPLLAAAACGSSAEPSPDVVGPFTGPVHRFVVDRVTFPNAMTAKQLGDDLDGDGAVDNQVGFVVGALAGQGNANAHIADMIASGILASFVEIQVDDLANADAAGVRYLARDGEGGEQLGGTFTSGVFASNRTRSTRHPVDTTLRLPIFADADPITVRLVGTEIDLVPDGKGGFDATIRGGIRAEEALAAATPGVVAMIEANTRDHLFLVSQMDEDDNGVITADEVARSSLVQALLAPDIQLFAGTTYAPTPSSHRLDSVSLGFAVHLAPCASGNCALGTPANTCFDRVLDSGETALDCGGTCALKCPTAAACNVPGDCQSGGCDGGHCRAPTCTDGIADGFETDVDCGGSCASKCANGKQCVDDVDCASGHCRGFLGGTCDANP